MTNTEMWLDETISHIKSIKSDIWMLHEIMSLPNCNDCKNKDCEYKPKWGEHIRYNCPLHTDRKTEPNLSEIPTSKCEPKDENCSEKPNNCEDEQQTELVNDSPILVKDLVDDEFNPYDEECMRCKHLKLQCEFVPSYCKYEPRDEPQTEEWYTWQDEQEYNDRWQTDPQTERSE